ncbi:hypothetical protein L3X38_004423 [Prunus dulcis]|uniref:Uncharacterized protein n=1 Tax=Prunus dulcis TaxID=3755 RepID=A0AAD4ZNT3_PRUDU|nr:hypothetical protein L3X38_004423 [Prunus dulcis]
MTSYGFQTHHEGTPPVAKKQFGYFDNASRVSRTTEPCGARIAAQNEVFSLRPTRNATRMDLVSPGPARIAAQIEVLSLRLERNMARLTLCFRGLRGWN